jgi:hypothetical protein
VRALAPCSRHGQALGPRLRGCQEIRTVNPKSPIPSFPRKREPRDFSHVPWAPAFAGATIGECCRFDYSLLRGDDGRAEVRHANFRNEVPVRPCHTFARA